MCSGSSQGVELMTADDDIYVVDRDVPWVRWAEPSPSIPMTKLGGQARRHNPPSALALLCCPQQRKTQTPVEWRSRLARLLLDAFLQLLAHGPPLILR